MPIFNYGNRKTNSNQNSNLICVFWLKHEGYIPFKKNLNAFNFEVFTGLLLLRERGTRVKQFSDMQVPMYLLIIISDKNTISLVFTLNV